MFVIIGVAGELWADGGIFLFSSHLQTTFECAGNVENVGGNEYTSECLLRKRCVCKLLKASPKRRPSIGMTAHPKMKERQQNYAKKLVMHARNLVKRLSEPHC